MRRILMVLFSAAALGAVAQSNPSISLYGYARPSHPGIVPAHYKNATMMDYQVFIAHPAGAFTLNEVRIGGKRYTFRTQQVAAPVTVPNRNIPQEPRTDTLVPPTTRLVEQVLLQNAPNRPGAGPLTVRYTWKGRKYQRTLKTWKELEPIMNE